VLSLEDKAKTTHQVSDLIEREYAEDEMGREYLDYINYHDEWKWVRLEDAQQETAKLIEQRNIEAKIVDRLEHRLAEKEQEIQLLKEKHENYLFKVAVESQEQFNEIIEENAKLEKKLAEARQHLEKRYDEIVDATWDQQSKGALALVVLKELRQKLE